MQEGVDNYSATLQTKHMTTTTKTPTGYWMATCTKGHRTRITDEQHTAEVKANPWSSMKYGATMCHCGWVAVFKPIMATESRTECGPRCTSAKGPSCDCKCNGENHGAGWAA